MAEHQDEWRIEHLHRIFKAGDKFIAGEITRDAADENVPARRIEAIFGRNPGIGTTEDTGERILPRAQGFAFVA